MCLLSASVGAPKASNHSQDVKAVQILLNISLPKLIQQTVVDLGFPGGGRAQVEEEPFHSGAIDLGIAGGSRVGRGQVLLSRHDASVSSRNGRYEAMSAPTVALVSSYW